MLTRDEVLAKSDIITRVVKVPEWDGEVTVRTLTAAEREEWEMLVLPRDAKGERIRKGIFEAALVCMAAVDEKGNRLFRIEDAESLATKSSAAVQRLWKVAARLSMVTEEDIQELAKNS